MRSAVVRRLWATALLAAVLVVAGCTPAARSELPRELRGPEVNSARQKAIGAADEDLRQLTGSAPLKANLDGCRDLRPRHAGISWRCAVVRTATVSNADAVAGLDDQHARLLDHGCAAFPGLATTRDRLASGIAVAELAEVTYHCPDSTIVSVRFSEPHDDDLAAKLDLTTLAHGPGAANVVSSQPVARANLDRLSDDRSQRVIMVVSVVRSYWSTPAE